ncbi:MAG: hypothetical protein DHS20C12_24710 [Pseudohongiella sp.]|nr:MAG: hypothetical protein DHS20C12_24710 [Pseudohongiella sp.]
MATASRVKRIQISMEALYRKSPKKPQCAGNPWQMPPKIERYGVEWGKLTLCCQPQGIERQYR